MKARINSISRSLKGNLIATFEILTDDGVLLNFAESNQDLELTIKKHTRKRSLDANAMLWASLGEIAQALQTDKWELYLQALRKYGKYEYIKMPTSAVESFKACYRECEVIAEDEEYTTMLCYFGSSTYTKEEFSYLLTGVLDDARQAGIRLHHGEEMDRWIASLQPPKSATCVVQP